MVRRLFSALPEAPTPAWSSPHQTPRALRASPHGGATIPVQPPTAPHPPPSSRRHLHLCTNMPAGAAAQANDVPGNAQRHSGHTCLSACGRERRPATEEVKQLWSAPPNTTNTTFFKAPAAVANSAFSFLLASTIYPLHLTPPPPPAPSSFAHLAESLSPPTPSTTTTTHTHTHTSIPPLSSRSTALSASVGLAAAASLRPHQLQSTSPLNPPTYTHTHWTSPTPPCLSPQSRL